MEVGVCVTVGAAEELPGVTDTTLVELHSVCIQANRNWAIFEQPLKDERLLRGLSRKST